MVRSYLELQRRFAHQQAELEESQPAFVAYVGDGTGGDPREDDEPNFLKVRSPGRGIFPAVYNPEVPVRNDVPVWVGPTPIDPDRWEIRSIATQYIDGLGEYAYMPFHAPSHVLFDEYGGDDVVWHMKQQGVFLLAAPTDPLSMRVFVHTDFYLYQSSWRWWPGGNSPSFAGMLPAAGFAKYVLLMVDAQTNTLETLEGNEFPIFPPVNPATHIPELPSGKFPSVAVYLTNSTTSLDWDNLFDVRLLVGGGADTTLPAPHPLLHPTTHSDTHTGTPPVEGSLIKAKEDNRWIQLFIGNPYELLHVAGSGTYPEWSPAVWSELVTPVGSDMQHHHSSPTDGSQNIRTLNELGYHEIDTEIINNTIGAGPYRRIYGQLYAADELDWIVTGTPGTIMWISGHPTYCSGANPVTVRHAVGNLRLHGSVNYVIDGPTKNLGFVYSSAGYWIEMGRDAPSAVANHTHSNVAGQGGTLQMAVSNLGGTNYAMVYQITGGFMEEDPNRLYYDYETGTFHAYSAEFGAKGSGSYFRTTELGDSYWEGGGGLPFGEIYGGTTGTTVNRVTWTQIDQFTANGLSNRTSPDHTNDHITVQIAGKYEVKAQFAALSSVADSYYFRIRANNGAKDFTNARTASYVTVANQANVVISGPIIDLSANDTVELWTFRGGAAAPLNLVLYNLSMSIVQVGGS